MTDRKGLSSSTLKLIAVIVMLIDHIAACLVVRMQLSAMRNGSEFVGEEIYALFVNGSLSKIYMTMRVIGRIAFPIFCFMIVEGFMKTRDVRKYVLRLTAFAFISEIPFDLAFSASYFDFDHQNVYFTLLIGLLTILVLDIIERNKEYIDTRLLMILNVITIVVGGLLAELMKTDYGAMGVWFIVAVYLGRNQKQTRIAYGAGSIVLLSLLNNNLIEALGALAYIPLSFYDGRRGVKLKYFFYAFYPVHLLLIHFICILLGISQYAVI